jgi:hypothetical protein
MTGWAIYRSIDNGSTFTYYGSSPAGYETAWALSPHSTDAVMAGAQWMGLFLRANASSDWTVIGQNTGDRGFDSLLALPGGFIMAGIPVRTDGFVTKLTPAGNAIVHSTYIGGVWYDTFRSVAAGPGGAWVAGQAYDSIPLNGVQLRDPQRSYDGFLLKISDQSPRNLDNSLTCAFEVQAARHLLSTDADAVHIDILSQAGCGWNVSSAAPWVHFNAPASGAGAGNTSFVVDPNRSPNTRSATISIAPAPGTTAQSVSFTISQPGTSCTYTYSTAPPVIAATGATLAATINTQAGCPWVASSSDDWVQVHGPETGFGSATISYTVARNAGLARTGRLRLAWTEQSIAQGAGIACALSLGKTDDVTPAGGGTGSLPVVALSSCSYTVVSNATWLQVTSGGNAAGSGTVAWTAAPNTTGAGRAGTITVGGQVYRVAQPAAASAGCTFTATPPEISAGSSRLKASFTLNASAASCAWNLQATVPWVEIFPLSGTGTTTISYTVYPNLTPRPRSTVVFFPGLAVPVTQAASPLEEHERFATLLYFNFLGRMPSPAEIAFRAGNLRGGMTPAQLVADFYTSAEFNKEARFVAGLYVGILGRNAEFGGWQFQRHALKDNLVGLEQLVSNFLNSAEFQLKYGNLDNAEFSKLMYRNILLREASPAEVAWRVGLLASNTLTRVNMARDLLKSQEFQIGTGSRLTTFLLYATFFLRDATPEEFATTSAQIEANSAVIPALINAFATSAELKALLN